jgi:cellulose 1,4-beta-cellobiosidase
MSGALLGLSLLAGAALAQQPGAYTPEVHPLLPTQTCSRAHGCVTANTSVVLDSNYRWLHNVGGYSPCVPGGFDPTFCPNVRVLLERRKRMLIKCADHGVCGQLRA